MADKTIRTLYFVAAAILLLPSLFFPISHDLSVFLLGAETIAEGGKIYVDYIDLKPPAVYYFFTLPYIIFGDGELGIRIFGFLWQALTIASLFYLIIKKTGRIHAAGISIVLYAMYYTSTNYYSTLQVETIIGLFTVWIIYFLADVKKNSSYLAASLLAGTIASFKPTFALVYLLIIVVLISDKKRIKLRLLSSLFFVLPVLISLLPLIDTEIREGFLEVMAYLSNYAASDESITGFIKRLVKFTSEYLGNELSLAVILPAFLILIKSRDNQRLIQISFLIFFALFLSILWEGKFFSYHYARFIIPLFLLSGLGIDYLLRNGYLKLKGKDFYSKLIITGLLVIFVVFSPLPRWVRVSPLPFLYFKSEESYNGYLNVTLQPGFRRYEHYKVGEYIREHKQKNDMLIVTGVGSSSIYQIADINNTSAFASSAFYFSKISPESWLKRYIEEVNTADWLVLQRNDPNPFFMKHEFTTIESFLALEELKRTLDSRYKKVFETEILMVYKAID